MQTQDTNTPHDHDRDDIIKYYDTGGKDDPNIDEIELDIHYIHYDRYGFVHDIRLSDKPRQSAAVEKKCLEKERSREEKWIMMVTEVRKWFLPGQVGDNAKFYQKMMDRVWKVNIVS